MPLLKFMHHYITAQAKAFSCHPKSLARGLIFLFKTFKNRQNTKPFIFENIRFNALEKKLDKIFPDDEQIEK